MVHSRFEIYPFARWSPALRKNLLRIGLAATVICALVMARIGMPLTSATTPGGILDFEFAKTASEAQRVMQAWGDAGVAAARTQTLVDFVYLVLYAGTLCLAVGLSVHVWARRSTLFGWIGVVLAWLAPAAGLLDAVENIAMLRQWSDGSNDQLAWLAWATAGAKFGIILCGMIYALFAAGLHIGDGIIGIGKRWYRNVVDDDAPAAVETEKRAS
jgi:hypothetical protein